MTKPASGGSTDGGGQLGSMSSGGVSDEGVPQVGSISLESMSPPAGSLTPWRGISGELARNAPNYMSRIHGRAAARPRHRQREGGPHRYCRNRHRMNLIHANTTIASPRRQRRDRAHHGPAHHTERGRSHASIVVNLDYAIIVTCGDAQQGERLSFRLSGSWFPVPIPGNRGTSSNEFSGTEGNHWEPLEKTRRKRSFRP